MIVRLLIIPIIRLHQTVFMMLFWENLIPVMIMTAGIIRKLKWIFCLPGNPIPVMIMTAGIILKQKLIPCLAQSRMFHPVTPARKLTRCFLPKWITPPSEQWLRLTMLHRMEVNMSERMETGLSRPEDPVRFSGEISADPFPARPIFKLLWMEKQIRVS